MEQIPKIKICGITSIEEAQILVQEKVEYGGFVLFYEKSKRNNSIQQAEAILHYLKEQGKNGFLVKTVAVMVSPTKEQIEQVEKIGFDYIQIHGKLSKEVFDEIHTPLFRAVWAKDEELLNRIKGCHKIEALLFDGLIPGAGQVFDWSLLETVKKQLAGWNVKLILAGGLTPENVKEAIRAVNPHVVDVSSGVEYEERKVGKDPEKIRKFVRAVREKKEN